ncbi:MAG: hypothetical protein AB7O62_04370 [Pirellulales bacterium]
MAIGMNIVFEDAPQDRAERGSQSVQLLADILPYVLAKYRVVPNVVPAGKAATNRLPVRFAADFQI